MSSRERAYVKPRVGRTITMFPHGRDTVARLEAFSHNVGSLKKELFVEIFNDGDQLARRKVNGRVFHEDERFLLNRRGTIGWFVAMPKDDEGGTRRYYIESGPYDQIEAAYLAMVLAES